MAKLSNYPVEGTQIIQTILSLLSIRSFSADIRTSGDRNVTMGEDELLTCKISGLDRPVDVTWIDPDGEKIPAGLSAGYVSDDGKAGFYYAGFQTTRLVIKAAQVALIDSAKTYKCAASSTQNSGSVMGEKSITVTPTIGNFLNTLLWA